MKAVMVVLVAAMLTGCIQEQDPKLRHKYFMDCLKVFENEAPSMPTNTWLTMVDNCKSAASNQSYIRSKDE